ncbi:EF hand-like protein [Leishmania major strain Friedlin]|uniref:EF hand-like protein n=1 Tax=Leishmania major TaxID=5664 RepID=Q4QG09_LEIMA|nr:EF hand-like protein [Leishmania major strain Friedlin]CAG9571149.1 EF_hand-like_protein [Leishmania major strain Friedlin]CAJ03146.1 EF hand-like protein [Leishmania major strain Friedlin]|eukprot:XP_001681889.1 EF hand-like protein [Leishmania major strain Friedlin]
MGDVYPGYGCPQAPQGYRANPMYDGQQPASYPATAGSLGGGAYAPPQYPAPPELVSGFQAADSDHNGRIDVAELNAALSSAGFRFSLGTTEKLLARYDLDRSGSITMEEFADLHEFITAMQQGFRQCDTSGDGRLDRREALEAFRLSGFVLGEQTFQAVMRKFDRQHRGSLGFDEYIELSIFVAQVRDAFAYYNRDRSCQVLFNFDTFLGTAAAIW